MKKISIWNDFKETVTCKSIESDMDVDVLIIGGGIAGISTLYELKDSNLRVILVERNTCGRGVTSRSTAKITYLQEKIMMNIRDLVGYKSAKKYLESQIEATNLLKDIILKEKIDCDLQKVSSYLFTNNEKNIKKLDEEYKFLKDSNIDVLELNRVPFNEPVKKALKVNNTYVFHPLKYIHFMKKRFQNQIYEHSKVESIDKENDYYKCRVNNFIIKAKYVVIATHYPYFLFPFLMPLKTHIETSYIGAKKGSSNKNISAINIDKPSISLRYHKDYLIYLYDSFMSSSIKNIKANFDNLMSTNKFDYIWSNKDIITNDYMPFIGRIYKKSDTLLIACGFNTWGMTNGTLSGKILANIILKKKNKYESLFSPNRRINLSKFIRFPIDVSSSVKSIIKSTKNNVNNKQVIYKNIDGDDVAIYVDNEGIEHLVYDRCPHMKCGIIFNEIEQTWDCLCHGSRFDIDGKCIEGPSNYDITYKKRD